MVELMELTPIEGLDAVRIINIPFSRTANGAVHRLDLAKLAEHLMVWELFDLDMKYHEVNRFRSVIPPRAYSMPVALLPGVGKWHTVVCPPQGQPVTIRTRPIEGLIVPAGYFVGLQSMERTRTSYTMLTHKSCRPSDTLSPEVERFLALWEHSSSDPACDENTGARLSLPPA